MIKTVIYSISVIVVYHDFSMIVFYMVYHFMYLGKLLWVCHIVSQ